MAEGKQREEWARLAAWMSLFANSNRDPKKKSAAFKPRDFDPFAKKRSSKPRRTLNRDESLKAICEGFGIKE